MRVPSNLSQNPLESGPFGSRSAPSAGGVHVKPSLFLWKMFSFRILDIQKPPEKWFFRGLVVPS